MSKIPPYLKPQDTVGIVCPAGYMDADKIQPCVETLQHWGYKVRLGKTTRSSSANYFSGTDEERLADLQEMLDADDIQAILFGRGGYGLTRIIDRINFRKFRRSPKWIAGFSDITLLHAHVGSRLGISTIHGPMAGAFREQEKRDGSSIYLSSLNDVWSGKKIKYHCAAHEWNRRGKVAGELVGGNLALLAHGVGTPSDIRTKGKILFLEDVGEYLYNVDRMLYQLKRSGKFDGLAGLVVGGFTDMKDTERPFGKPVLQIVREAVQEFDFPVCFDFPVGHQAENLALKMNVPYTLNVGSKKVQLSEYRDT